MMTRRFFIGGLASAVSLGPRRLFSAPNGAFSARKPLLSFGVLSDVHVCLDKGGERLHPEYTTETLTKAFSWFRDNGADAVVIAGDMAHSGLAGELKALADAWFKVFPGDKAPDGHPVERVFVFGNHDWSSPGRAKIVFADEKVRNENLLVNNPRKWWDAIFHEEWTPFFDKEVKGYRFIGAHWHRGGCSGKNERFTKGMKEFYAGRKGLLDPSKPFFHIQHPHPRGTVHGPGVWGQDDGVSTGILSAFPNAISFSGHSHTSLTDERSIWQGGFTAIGCASLRDVSLGIPGVIDMPPYGFENARGHGHEKKTDALKAMEIPFRKNCQQGQFIRVFSDCVVISRREFITGTAICDDLVMPLPVAEKKPFAFAPRAAKALAPEFAKDAKLGVKKVKAKLRGRKEKADAWELTIPAATAARGARAGVFEITADGKDGKKFPFALADETARFPATDPRTTRPVIFRVACERVPAEDVTFTVRAVSCWGKKSAPLVGSL